METGAADITALLRRWKDGDRDAEGFLFEAVRPRLIRLAHDLLRRERPNSSLQPSVLISEIYLRIAGKEIDWRDRAHFFAFSARIMRRYLIDRARSKDQKGQRRIDPGAEADEFPDAALDESKIVLALSIDTALNELAQIHPECTSVIELKFFLTLTDEETADALGLTLRTVQRRWEQGREWLFRRLEPKPCSKPQGMTSST
jgi:RNA polymerase sigma factor (TIGR02999 family)